jgi:hypothetical protein
MEPIRPVARPERGASPVPAVRRLTREEREEAARERERRRGERRRGERARAASDDPPPGGLDLRA